MTIQNNGEETNPQKNSTGISFSKIIRKTIRIILLTSVTILIGVILLILTAIIFHQPVETHEAALKPVIYLYPPHTTHIQVGLDYQGDLFASYPPFDDSINGWSVIAHPDATLQNIKDNKEYSYIFWEGTPDKKIDWDFSKGFVVKGENIISFLQEKLAQLGLTPKEYNEFIVYWYPLMKNNNYNLIHFAEEQYTQTAPLHIKPTPDSMLRVFMVSKPLDEYMDIDEQILKPFHRKGFSVIEWGGSIVQ